MSFLHSHINIHWTHSSYYKPIVCALLEPLRPCTGVNTKESLCFGRGSLRNSVWRNRSDRGVVVGGHDVGRNLVNVIANVSAMSIFGWGKGGKCVMHRSASRRRV